MKLTTPERMAQARQHVTPMFAAALALGQKQSRKNGYKPGGATARGSVLKTVYGVAVSTREGDRDETRDEGKG